MSVKKFRFSILALAFGVLFMAGTKSVMAQKATTVTTTLQEPLNYVGLTCDTFEPITFTGFEKTVYEVTNNGDGSPLKLKTSSSWEGVSGTTPSGVVYKGMSKSKESFDLVLPSVNKISTYQRWTGKGKVPDLIYRLKYNVKTDIYGNVTRDKETEITECK